MKKITIYKAADGTRFEDAAECKKYESLLLTVNKIMSGLVPSPKDPYCKFANGEGYIQQDEAIVETARKEITDLGNEYLEQERYGPWSFWCIGRLFDDCGNKVLYWAWGRLANIDKNYREWGQQYYAIHGGENKPYVEEEE